MQAVVGGATCRDRAVVGDQMMTAVSTVGSQAQSVCFKEVGVSQGGKVGVRKRLLSLKDLRGGRVI